MGIRFVNNFNAPLAAGLAAGDTTIPLQAGYGAILNAKLAGPLGTDHLYGTLVNSANDIEIVKVTALSGDDLTVVRGVDDTVARPWLAGDIISMRLCALAINEALQVNAAKADVDSQVFTGTPSLPTGTIAVTQAPGDSSTKIATTAFVSAAVAAASTDQETYTDDAIADLVQYKAKQTASGNTEFAFTDIPANATRIVVMYKGLSTSSTPGYGLQLGTSAGYASSGYDSSFGYWNEAYQSATSQFDFFATTVTAAHAHSGVIELTRFADGEHIWMMTHNLVRDGSNYPFHGGGHVTLAGELDRLKILFDGVNTFDAGSVSVLVEL